MPSDERLARVHEVLRPRRDAFRAALAATAEQIRAFLRAQRATPSNGRGARLASELGAFGADRIDVTRLASVFQAGATLDPATNTAVERAAATLTALAAEGGLPVDVDVPSGGDLRQVTGEALASIGRAFGAVRAFELARAGGRRLEDVALEADGLPYARWSRGERRLAPPLVVTVDGADLRAECLAEFLDGTQQIVLVVRGACAPAPLVRLITPGTFVLQASDAAGLDRLAAWEGPAIAALVPDTAARFTHDPMGGADAWDRLTVAFLPERAPRLAVGGASASQQGEELRLLRVLAARPTALPAAADGAGAVGAAATVPADDPAGRLAAWLLAQADLSELG